MTGGTLLDPLKDDPVDGEPFADQRVQIYPGEQHVATVSQRRKLRFKLPANLIVNSLVEKSDLRLVVLLKVKIPIPNDPLASDEFSALTLDDRMRSRWPAVMTAEVVSLGKINCQRLDWLSHARFLWEGCLGDKTNFNNCRNQAKHRGNQSRLASAPAPAYFPTATEDTG